VTPLRIVPTEAKTTAEHTAHTLKQTKAKLKNNTEGIQQTVTDMQQGNNAADEARPAAKEVTDVGRTAL
jgi:methyl-accepting chemotaxis protein